MTFLQAHLLPRLPAHSLSGPPSTSLFALTLPLLLLSCERCASRSYKHCVLFVSHENIQSIELDFTVGMYLNPPKAFI